MVLAAQRGRIVDLFTVSIESIRFYIGIGLLLLQLLVLLAVFWRR